MCLCFVPGIDYAAIHLWPDNWKRVDQDFGRIWLSNHSANGQMLNKPVVLEEFGKVGGAERHMSTCQFLSQCCQEVPKT